MYFVEGGVYTDTDFKTLEVGTEEGYGPFVAYQDAFDAWSAHTWARVDTCCHRLTIKQEYKKLGDRASLDETLPMGDLITEDIAYFSDKLYFG